MTINIILLSLAVFPVLLLGGFIYRQDRFEKEPLSKLLKAFLFGCLSIIPAIILETILQTIGILFSWSSVLSGLYEGFVVAGFSEELCKLVMLSWAIWKSREFNEYFDGIVYSTFVALGFACCENIQYVFLQDTFASAVSTGVMRAILSVPGHFLFGVVMGYYFALAKFDPPHRSANFTKALLYPMLLHGTFDALLMIPEKMGNAIPLISTVFFCLFIYFDIRLWKIGSRKLKDLQLKTMLQNIDNDGPYYNTPTDENPFSNFDWNA